MSKVIKVNAPESVTPLTKQEIIDSIIDEPIVINKRFKPVLYYRYVIVFSLICLFVCSLILIK